MSQSMDIYEDRAASPAETATPSDSARGAILAGWAVILLFFGGFGAWAVTAPLNGAVVGEAVVKVEGNRKSVQHLEGGIVGAINVREGDIVRAGDLLLVLDDSQARASHNQIDQQLTLLRATEARLLAEFAGAAAIEFPPEFLESAEAHVALAMEGQRKEFDSRRQAIAGNELILRQKAAQLDEQILGLQAKGHFLEKQLASVRGERESLEDLVREGLVTKSRVLQLERTASSLEGEIAGAASGVAGARSALDEVSEQIAQLGKDRQSEITARLREVQSEIADLRSQLQKAATTLGRNEIRSPYSGKVVDLNVFSVGGVVKPGETILDIVPLDTSMVVEGRVRVEDISDVAPGMRSEIHLTSYKQRLTPVLDGTITEVSADRLTDERSGTSYFNVLVAIDPDQLAQRHDIQLYPGMPATMIIVTEERTALDYLVGPLTATLSRSFRQK
jgi:epimerase transport system membrane fusion protein